MSRSRSIRIDVGARERVAVLGDAVVRLDLRRVRIEFEAEARDGPRGKLLPVDVRIGDRVRVVVADGAVQLALDRQSGERGDLPLEPRVDVSEFLAERRGRGRLAVRACEHRHVGMRVRECAQVGRDRFEQRQQRIAPRFLERDAVREVVDVLGRAREMDELRDARDLGRRRRSRSFSQYSTALTSWFVVRSIALTRAASATRERRDDRVERRARIVRERRHFGDGGLGGKRQRARPFRRARAGESVPNSLNCSRSASHLRRVAAVERRQRGQACVFGVVHGIFASNRV